MVQAFTLCWQDWCNSDSGVLCTHNTVTVSANFPRISLKETL